MVIYGFGNIYKRNNTISYVYSLFSRLRCWFCRINTFSKCNSTMYSNSNGRNSIGFTKNTSNNCPFWHINLYQSKFISYRKCFNYTSNCLWCEFNKMDNNNFNRIFFSFRWCFESILQSIRRWLCKWFCGLNNHCRSNCSLYNISFKII